MILQRNDGTNRRFRRTNSAPTLVASNQTRNFFQRRTRSMDRRIHLDAQAKIDTWSAAVTTAPIKFSSKPKIYIKPEGKSRVDTWLVSDHRKLQNRVQVSSACSFPNDYHPYLNVTI